MTLTLDLAPELEARLKEKAAQHAIPLSEFVMRVLEQEASLQEPRAEETAGEHLLRITQEIFGSMPEEERQKLPSDYAKNYKHYIHGYPKEEE